MIVEKIDEKERKEIILYLNEVGLLHKKQKVSDKVLKNVVEYTTGKEVLPHQAIYYLREFMNNHKGLPKLNKTTRKNPYRQKTLDLYGNTCMSCQTYFKTDKELRVIEVFDLDIVRELKVLNHQIVCNNCLKKNQKELKNLDLRFQPENYNRFSSEVQARLSSIATRSAYWEEISHSF